jgi:hypothetical protein
VSCWHSIAPKVPIMGESFLLWAGILSLRSHNRLRPCKIVEIMQDGFLLLLQEELLWDELKLYENILNPSEMY